MLITPDAGVGIPHRRVPRLKGLVGVWFVLRLMRYVGEFVGELWGDRDARHVTRAFV